MTNRLELSWKVDGFVDEQRYYCSETPIDPENLPPPKVILAGDVRTYVDTVIEIGKTYYVCVGSVKNGIEKVSRLTSALAGVLWDPGKLTNKPKLWLSSESVIADSLNRISQVNDLSSAASLFTQSSNTNKPLLVVDSTLNRPAMGFDGFNDRMVCTNIAAQQIAKNAGIIWSFAIIKNDQKAEGSNSILTFSSGASDNAIRLNFNASSTTSNSPYITLRRIDSEPNISVYDNSVYEHDYQIILYYVNYSSANIKIYKDGNLDLSQAALTAGLSSNTDSISVTLGDFQPAVTTRPFRGLIFESLTGNTALTNAEIDKLFGWAAHKYGLQDNLPVGHPYKTLAPVL